jgi:hypothetical protein
MKVNPISDADRGGGISQKLAQGLSMQFKSTKTSMRRQERRACKKLLRKIVDGQIATIVMSLVTLYALFGVCNFHNLKMYVGRLQSVADNKGG